MDTDNEGGPEGAPPASEYRLAHFLLDPFLGARFPIGAFLRVGGRARFIPAPRVPDLRDYPDDAALLSAVTNCLKVDPYRSTPPSPSVLFDEWTAVPAEAHDAGAWVVEMMNCSRGRLFSLAAPETPPDEAAREIAGRPAVLLDLRLLDLRALGERLDAHAKGAALEQALPALEALAAVAREVLRRESLAAGREPPAPRVERPQVVDAGASAAAPTVPDPLSAVDGAGGPLATLGAWADGRAAALTRLAATLDAEASSFEREAESAQGRFDEAMARVPEVGPAAARLAGAAATAGRGRLCSRNGAAALRRAAADLREAAGVEAEAGVGSGVDFGTAPSTRAESGVVQFGDDWPGVFVRGDDAFGYAASLRQCGLAGGVDPEAYSDADVASGKAARHAFACASLGGLASLLERSATSSPGHRVDLRLKPVGDCLAATPATAAENGAARFILSTDGTEPRFADRWPRVCARAASSPRRTPIAEQAAARGEAVPVGAFAREIRARGYDVPPLVADGAILWEEPHGADAVFTASVGRRTGLVWRSGLAALVTWCAVDADVAQATDVELLQERGLAERCARGLLSQRDDESRACALSDRPALAIAALDAELDRREAGYAAEEP